MSVDSSWLDKPLGYFLNGVIGGGTPSRKIANYWDGDIPWASVKDFRDDIQELSETEEYISSHGLEKSASNLISPGVLLVCTRMAVGRAALTTRSTAINQDVKALYPNDLLLSKYLLYLLRLYRPELEAASIGSTVKGLSLKQLHSLPVRVPPLFQQREIITILDTIDSQIQRTEQLIAKLKQQREGLLHDLLTRGLNEHGELRDPDVHPELFKDSVLGRIPKEWSVKSLKDLYAVPSRNGLYKSPRYYGKGTLMIHMPQMFRGLTIDSSDAARVQITPAEYKRFSLANGDLVFARRSLNFDGAGKCTLISELVEATTFESSIIRVRLLLDLIRPDFVNYFLNSNIGTRLRNPLIRQVAVSGVSSEDIGTIPIPFLIHREQDMIVNTIHLYDSNIQIESSHLAKLKHYKQGLMHDLLTGRVRVGASVEA